MSRGTFIALFSFASISAMAGQIELSNGDKIGGTLKAIASDNVIWAIGEIGEVTVKKSNVKDLKISDPIKIRGFDTPCQWLGLDSGKVAVDCGSGPKSFSLMTLEDVVLFKSREQSLHAYGGKLTLLGSEKTGNINSSNWLIAVEVSLRQQDFRHDIELRYEGEALETEARETVGGVETTSKDSQITEYYKGGYGLDWFFRPRWFLLGDLIAEKDDAKRILERHITGIGSGFQWWELEKTALKIELSAQQTKERYELSVEEIADGDDVSREFASGRIAINYRYKLPRDVALFHRSNLSQRLDESDDWFARAETGLSAPLGLGISAAINVDYDYVNNPPEDVEREDITYRLGVTYGW